MKSQLKFLVVLLLAPFVGLSQAPADLDKVEPGRFDQGKMWTFENPPLQYFEEAYNFKPDQEWLDDVRKSALRFASWCSASFISEQGLIMTNHHCSRSVVASVMKEGENFDENGFYATSMEEERKVPNLFVDQLHMIADISDAVKSRAEGVSVDSALQKIQADYKKKEEWADLIMETRTFYSGGQFSLYGFKRYEDIRLVLYPELPLGYYGGDPDNFTYPRYNLDFTFYRAYDENGDPLSPSNYFEFNPDGAVEDEAVFVIGNPGSTGRYLTMSQLYFQRDVSVPAILSLVKNRMEILMDYAEEVEDVYRKDSITNVAFSLSNTEKAYSGRLDGFYDPYLMTKKEKKEANLRENFSFEGKSPWVKLEDNMKQATLHYPEVVFLSPNGLRGKLNIILHKLFDYKAAVETGNEDAADAQEKDMRELVSSLDPALELALFSTLLTELKIHSRKDYINELLAGASPEQRTKEVMEKSILLNNPDKFFKLKPTKLDKEVLVTFASTMVASYRESAGKMSALNQENDQHQEKIMNMQFDISGFGSPPDATFSLRIADGIVKGYEYNGTLAPYKTTYFGLYDRHYSHEQKFPWNLPEKWKNPPMELLKSPLNFVSTADIIGGNSGSPVINTEGEVVGLAFDGNIESLPGYFIFDDTYNRTVSVHSGGITAAVKYIYKAERLLSELNAE